MASTVNNFIDHTLSRCLPFSHLDADQRARLGRDIRMQRISRHELLVHRGDRPKGLYLVVEGEIKLFLMSASGSERIVRIAHNSDTFCEESAFGDTPQALSAQAMRESIVLFLPREALRRAMHGDDALTEALMARMSERMNELIVGMEQCEQRNSAQRVAHFLVKHAEPASDAHEVRLPTSKQAIASQLNMTPESFSRVLSRLTREGFIHSRGNRAIRLNDLSGLRQLAA